MPVQVVPAGTATEKGYVDDQQQLRSSRVRKTYKVLVHIRGTLHQSHLDERSFVPATGRTGWRDLSLITRDLLSDCGLGTS